MLIFKVATQKNVASLTGQKLFRPHIGMSMMAARPMAQFSTEENPTAKTFKTFKTFGEDQNSQANTTRQKKPSLFSKMQKPVELGNPRKAKKSENEPKKRT